MPSLGRTALTIPKAAEPNSLHYLGESYLFFLLMKSTGKPTMLLVHFPIDYTCTKQAVPRRTVVFMEYCLLLHGRMEFYCTGIFS